MPMIYLSPSTQENNFYVNGGTEEEWMNYLADEMEPFLDASGILYVRNTPSMTAASSIRASNEGDYSLHLALHSNAAPEGRYGEVRGILVFYYPTSTQGRKASELVAEQFKTIYPLPDLVRTVPSTTIGEVRLVRAPSVFLELGFHDNLQDAIWIKSNIQLAAKCLVQALCTYFNSPFLTPIPPRLGVVDVNYGALNIRTRPDTSAYILAQAYDGAQLTVVNQWEDWYLVRFDGIVGYAKADYVALLF